jgi:DNA polymerase III delta prime subunit
MNNLILSEKYRPGTIDECVLPESTKEQIKGLIKEGNIPSMLFVGSAGCGKTTLARAIANELGADILFVNASMEGIDMIRTKVMQFASTVSFSNAKKITVLDEADGLSQAAQQALRGFIEEFGKNHSIIFTANYANKVIDAIHSRCKVVDFKISAKDKPLLAAKFAKRIFRILDIEKVEYEQPAVIELIMKKFPDFRSVLNEIQGYAAGGKIDSGILSNLSDATFSELIKSLKAKKFSEVRKWVADNSDMESSHLFRMFYDTAHEKLEQKSIPEVILILGEFSYKDYFVADKEINRMAFLTTIMINSNIMWK